MATRASAPSTTRPRAERGGRKRTATLASIPGISDLTAAILLIETPEFGSIDAKQTASLAGLAPMPHASGTWKGKDHILGGRVVLRQALYMPALVAARFNPDLKQLHQRLTEAGKPQKVEITAVMRKLVVFANALLKKGHQWNQKSACAQRILSTSQKQLQVASASFVVCLR